MAGINPVSGLNPDFQRAFEAAVAAEKKPVTRLEGQKERITERMSLLDDIIGRVGEVSSLLPNLNTPFAIRDLTVDSSEKKVITGTADKRVAIPGEHSFEVLRLAKSATAMSNALPDRDYTQLGSGYFVFETADGDTREVFVDNDNATLDGLARIINNANIGMRASVINDSADPENGFRLLLSAEGTGEGKDVEYPEFYFVDGEEDFYIERTNPAENARVRFEGFEFEFSGNELKDVVPGLTVKIKGLTDYGKPETLTIKQDVANTSVKVKELVDKVNSVLGFIQIQNDVDENTDTRRTLGGDYTMRLSQFRLRNALQENFLSVEGKTVRSLSDIGIQFNRQGLLDFDEKSFKDALSKNFDEVVDLLAGDGVTYGVITRLSHTMNSLSSGRLGMLATQKRNYESQIARIDRRIEQKNEQVEKKSALLKERLSKAQAALDAVSSQSAIIGGAGAGGGLLG